MEAERIQELIAKYNAMTADPAELREIERLIGDGLIDMGDLVELRAIEEGIDDLETPAHSPALDEKFYAMLQTERQSVRRSSSFRWADLFSATDLMPRLAFAVVALLVGVMAGMSLHPSQQKDLQIQQLGQEVGALRELMMLSMLEKESPTERLKAVSLTHEMDQVSKTVTGALLQTLNRDENVNVRLAALDALRPYSEQSGIREALIRSISVQDSPLVQIALAELMAALQEKSSLKELQKLMRDDNTPNEVKTKIRESIEVLS